MVRWKVNGRARRRRRRGDSRSSLTMVDCLRRYRPAMLIDVHNDVLGVHGYILDVSDNLDIRTLSFGMFVAHSGCTLCQS